MSTLYKPIEIEKLKKVYLDLVTMQLQIDQNGGPKENVELFEEYLMLRKKMLKRFGLPDKEGFAKILYVDNQQPELEIDDRLKMLHSVASDYLLSEAKSECQILKEAQENRESPFEVLPELGITTHGYTIFIYNHILLSKRDTVEDILAELKKANNSKTLNALGKLEQGNVKKPKQIIKKLKQDDIKYIDDFISTFPQKDRQEENIFMKFDPPGKPGVSIKE